MPKKLTETDRRARKEFGLFIRRAKSELKIDTAALSRQTKIAEGALRSYMQGRSRPSPDKLRELVRVLGKGIIKPFGTDVDLSEPLPRTPFRMYDDQDGRLVRVELDQVSLPIKGALVIREALVQYGVIPRDDGDESPPGTKP